MLQSYKRLLDDEPVHADYELPESGKQVGRFSSIAQGFQHNAIHILYGLILLVMSVTIVLLSLMLSKLHHAASDNVAALSCSCGASVAEARSLSCSFDTLSGAWLPQYCIDSELTAQFERSGDGPGGSWQYFADRERTREMTIDEVAALADRPNAVYYASSDWHIQHCWFLWRKEVRQKYTGVTLEGRFNNVGHVEHCARAVAKAIKQPELGVELGVALNSDNNPRPDVE
ncbi:hypothetical protein F5Y16DRAFT_372263 [Xylariaceae sp. FL0255]|nr:hypothetical protein F5Y16DRAFT_372263 [Xylariaceae sp. FL0255]